MTVRKPSRRASGGALMTGVKRSLMTAAERMAAAERRQWRRMRRRMSPPIAGRPFDVDVLGEPTKDPFWDRSFRLQSVKEGIDLIRLGALRSLKDSGFSPKHSSLMALVETFKDWVGPIGKVEPPSYREFDGMPRVKRIRITRALAVLADLEELEHVLQGSNGRGAKAAHYALLAGFHSGDAAVNQVIASQERQRRVTAQKNAVAQRRRATKRVCDAVAKLRRENTHLSEKAAAREYLKRRDKAWLSATDTERDQMIEALTRRMRRARAHKNTGR